MDKSLNVIIPYIIYPFDVMVSIGQSDKQLKKSLEQNGTEWDNALIFDGIGQGRCVMLDGGQTVLRLWNYPIYASDFGSLQHEIFHAVEFLMMRIGMKLCKKSDEAYAYLIGYLTTEIYKCLKYPSLRH